MPDATLEKEPKINNEDKKENRFFRIESLFVAFILTFLIFIFMSIWNTRETQYCDVYLPGDYVDTNVQSRNIKHESDGRITYNLGGQSKTFLVSSYAVVCK